MSPLEQVIEDLLQNTQTMSRKQFNKRNQDVTNHLSQLPTTQRLLRNADPNEAKLFAVSSGEAQARFHADLMKEMQAIRNATSRPDAERLLSLASALNRISNVASIEEKITEMKQQHEEYQVNISYLESTYKDNEKALQTYRQQQSHSLHDNKKTLAETEQELYQEESKMNTNEELLQGKRLKLEQLKSLIKEKRHQLSQLEKQQLHTNTNDHHNSKTDNNHQLLENIERLKRTILTKKSILASSSSSSPSLPLTGNTPSTATMDQLSCSGKISSSSASTITAPAQTLFDQLQSKINKAYKTNVSSDTMKGNTSNKEIISILELIIQALQDMKIRYDKAQFLEDQLEKMNDLKQKILIKAKGVKDNNQEALMASILVLLENHGRMRLESLKDQATTIAIGLGLDSSQGSQAIYSWVGKTAISIDRSQDDSYVQSNWEE